MPRVAFVTAIVTHYRVPFHERVRTELARTGITYDLIYSLPLGAEAAKRDTVELAWATPVPIRPVGPGGKALWQSAWGAIRGAELVVIGQENRFLLNYLLQLAPRRFRPLVALWGHGRNFQARNRASRGERWKAWWATRADWWFAYTEETRRHVLSLGFPADRITVFNNSVDTAEARALAAAVTPARLAERRRALGLAGTEVGVFVGGLYADKRLDFLLAAADRIRARRPAFELLIVGAGDAAPALAAACADRPWIHLTGPRFGADKAELMRLGALFLMPGLVGLGLLDAAAAGLPTITTAFPYHSPEIAYLEDGTSGLIVADWTSAAAYADAVADLLAAPDRLAAMQRAAHALSERHTIEAMADRFAAGVRDALAAGARRA